MFLRRNLTGFNQVLLLNTLCKQVRDEAQAQSKSLTSSSAVAVSMVVAAFLLGILLGSPRSILLGSPGVLLGIPLAPPSGTWGPQDILSQGGIIGGPGCLIHVVFCDGIISGRTKYILLLDPMDPGNLNIPGGGPQPAQTWRKTSARILWGKGGEALRRAHHPPIRPLLHPKTRL